MKDTCKVRDAGAGDADAIVERVQEHAAESGESTSIEVSYVRHYLASGRGTILIAEREGQVSGLLSYSIRPDLYHAADVCLIEELVVARAERRRGVAWALLAELTRRAERTGCAEISAAADRGNAEALGLYRGQGLTEESVLVERHLPLGRGR